MNASRLFSSALTLALLGGACSRSPKPQAPPPVAPVAPQTETAQPAAPPRSADPVESPLDGDLAAATEHAYRSGLLGDVYFDLDLATLRDDARERLRKNFDFLAAHPEFVVSIEGHCDERGTNDYNLALGERRAQAAISYLATAGVTAGRLRSVSYGEERPVCTDSAESCWQRNRRAHFVLVDRVGGR
jgi:peptidoglycan-associated lipoprotein